MPARQAFCRRAYLIVRILLSNLMGGCLNGDAVPGAIGAIALPNTIMNLTIRDEQPGEESAIFALTDDAFKTMPMASGDEADLVDELRADGALTLSLVAIREDEIVGHVAFSPAHLGDDAGWFGLGPVSVRPDLHRKGIGTALMKSGLDRLRALEAKGCLTVGHPDYYPRFGFSAHPDLTFEGKAGPHVMALGFDGSQPTGEIRFHPAFEGV